MEKRGNRDEMVIATKATTGYRSDRPDQSNYCGNHSKSLKVSVDASLRKLKTSYIDILYVHVRCCQPCPFTFKMQPAQCRQR